MAGQSTTAQQVQGHLLVDGFGYLNISDDNVWYCLRSFSFVFLCLMILALVGVWILEDKKPPRSQLNSKGGWGKWNYLWPRMWLLLTKIYFTVGFQLYSKLSFYIIALLIINLFFPSNTSSTPPVLSHRYSPTPTAWFLYSMWHLSTLDCNILGWLNMSPYESIKFLTQIWHYPNK